MGTVVFPEADVKIFLDASAEERAQRRYKQLQDKGFDVNFERLLTEIRERDDRDRNRAVAPLKPAEDALVVDSTSMTIDEVLATVLLPMQSNNLVMSAQTDVSRLCTKDGADNLKQPRLCRIASGCFIL